MKVYLNTVMANASGVYRPHPKGLPVEVPDQDAQNIIAAGYGRPVDGELPNPASLRVAKPKKVKEDEDEEPEQAEGNDSPELETAAAASGNETATKPKPPKK
jgi:hypothetical protein